MLHFPISYWHWHTPANSPSCFDQAMDADGDLGAIGDVRKGGGKPQDRERLDCQAVDIWVCKNHMQNVNIFPNIPFLYHSSERLTCIILKDLPLSLQQ